MPQITTLIFDYDGVFIPDEYWGLKQVCPDEKVIEEYEQKYYTKNDCSEFWAQLRAYFSLNFSDSDLCKFYGNEDSGQQKHKKSLFALVKSLSVQFTIALLSNQIRDRTDYLRKYEDFSYFNKLFFSNEIGLRKPDSRIFHSVLNTLKEKPEHCLYIDDADENIQTARKIGMQTYHWRKSSEGFDLLEKLLTKNRIGHCNF